MNGTKDASTLKSAAETLAGKGAPDIFSSGTAYAGFQCAYNAFHLPKLEQPELSEILLSLPQNSLSFRAKFEGRTTNYDWTPGLAFLIPAGASATYWYSERALRFHLRLKEGHLASHAQSRGLDPARVNLPWAFGVPDPCLAAMGQALFHEVKDGMPGGRLFGESLREAICAHLVARYAGQAERPLAGGLGSLALTRLLDLIEERLGEDLSIETLADEAGYSPWHFQRLFKQSVGEPVHRYVMRRRTERAITLLRTGETADMAAIQSGFAHDGHLRRWVQRLYGLRPGDFKR